MVGYQTVLRSCPNPPGECLGVLLELLAREAAALAAIISNSFSTDGLTHPGMSGSWYFLYKFRSIFSSVR